MTVIAHKDITSPKRGRNVRELEKYIGVLQIDYPEIEEIPEEAITIEEGIEEFWSHLEQHFGHGLRKYEEV